MKIWSPLPRSTTFVSPVTSDTPASAHAARIEATIRFRSRIGSPSSRMKAAERYSGVAPPTARSLTVPCTAKRPMSPPGKKRRMYHERVGRKGDPRQLHAIAGLCVASCSVA